MSSKLSNFTHVTECDFLRMKCAIVLIEMQRISRSIMFLSILCKREANKKQVFLQVLREYKKQNT